MNDLAIDWHPTGSRHICFPPPVGTDEDYIVLMTKENESKLLDTWLDYDGDPARIPDIYKENTPAFMSFRFGEYNLIVTQSQDFYERFVKATRMAKTLNLLNKKDRVVLFQKILYGVDINPV